MYRKGNRQNAMIGANRLGINFFFSVIEIGKIVILLNPLPGIQKLLWILTNFVFNQKIL